MLDAVARHATNISDCFTKHKKFAHPGPTRRRPNRLETNSAIIDDFSTLLSFEEVHVVVDYMLDGEIC